MPAHAPQTGLDIVPRQRTDMEIRDLSQRERECLLMTATGASDADVALRIAISESTVRFHLRNAARKLSASSRREAIYIAAKQNLI